MSYFQCDAGKKYYPFGRGGRENLLNALSFAARIEDGRPDIVDKENEIPKSTCGSKKQSLQQGSLGDMYDRLQHCPLHSIPLSAETSGVEEHGHIDVNHRNGLGKIPTPMVLKSLDSPVAKSFSKLADDVIVEIIKLQMDALVVPSISLNADHRLVLRYFTTQQAFEYIFDALELRLRDPQSGKLVTNHIDLRKQLTGVTPIVFDCKGNYGVAINWSDGYYTDIFPFSILKSIALELSGKE